MLAGSGVVGDGDTKPADLAAHLAARLPDYMVPVHWIELAALPLTSSGKLDRNALPAPDYAASNAAEPTAERPRTALETAIAEVWASVIGRGSPRTSSKPCKIFTVYATGPYRTEIPTRWREESHVPGELSGFRVESPVRFEGRLDQGR